MRRFRVLPQLRSGLFVTTVLSNEQFERSLKRKVREAYISIQMEESLLRTQILNMYLNTTYYSNELPTVLRLQVLSNKHASDLTLAEAATLAGLPISLLPMTQLLIQRQQEKGSNTVLERMLLAERYYTGTGTMKLLLRTNPTLVLTDNVASSLLD